MYTFRALVHLAIGSFPELTKRKGSFEDNWYMPEKDCHTHAHDDVINHRDRVFLSYRRYRY